MRFTLTPWIRVGLLLFILGNTASAQPIVDSIYNQGVANAISNARFLADIEWTPLADIPNNSGFFRKGVPVKGVPYSSSKEIASYVGLDVSVYTFLSAVQNIHSLIYTENIGMPPYNGDNCATYYGLVCSTAVGVALGFKFPYATVFYPTLTILERKEVNSLEDLDLCDIGWKSGHVYMIINILREEGDVKYIDLFEASGTNVHISRLSEQDFLLRQSIDNPTYFRYKNLSSVKAIENDIYSFNQNLCPSKGDRCMYRTDETVVINILDRSEYSHIDLYATGTEKKISSRVIDDEIRYSSLPAGSYYACLSNNAGLFSERVWFDVVSVFTKLKILKNGKIRISYRSKNATPVYGVLCYSNYNYYSYIELPERNRKRGRVDIDFDLQRENIYYRIFFQGKYGKVSSVPNRIFRNDSL